MSWIRNTSIFLLFIFIFMEIGSYVLTKANLLLVNETPAFYYNDNSPLSSLDPIYWTESDPWGAWHPKNTRLRFKALNLTVKSCFDVAMEFNEIGARDGSFQDLDNESLILLGDSFAEGFGVSLPDTSQFLIEQQLDLNILNMGTSSSFGPLQQLLLYDEFKDKLPHKGLIIYVLPANDFSDNDAAHWAKLGPDHTKKYRPYFSSGENPLLPFYFDESVKKGKPSDSITKKFIKDHFWTANVLRTFLLLMRGDTNNTVLSFYYDAEINQQENLLLAYKEILTKADEKDVLFVVIPTQEDISRFQNSDKPDSYKQQMWYKGFVSFAMRSNQRVSMLDLMDYLPSNTEELFFTCDPHWSPKGNKWAADIVSNHILDKKLFSK